jgi:broad specificity phosphatase PhoE
VPADRVHLVRHGEVFNPDGVLYGRLPGYRLSDLGQRMAAAAADSMAGRPIVRLVSSPLQRTHESAAPWAARFGLEPVDDARVIEPSNRFEGSHVRTEIRRPRNWPYLVAPWRPSWGEPFRSIAARMMAAVDDAFDSVPSGEVVIVSHQLPIWMVALTVAGRRLAHDPRKRRCSLSSITSLERRADAGPHGRVVEVGYQEPAADLLARSIDLGAV